MEEAAGKTGRPTIASLYEKEHPPLPDGRGSVWVLCTISDIASRARKRTVSRRVFTQALTE
jgi:hypothetical protein